MAIVFPIVTSYNDKGTKKADDAFTKLGKKFLAVFSVAKVVQFGKASVHAFSEASKEAQLLATQLNTVNLGFASPFINEFIDKLALATGVAGGDLTNAFVSLSQATGDATTAQKLLQTALDVSLGTGKDLQTVSNALQRAYKGEVTALAKLKIGYTAAELKGKKFDDVLAELQKKFTGAAADAVDTFAGKMARLAEGADQAKEAFGERLVGALEDSQVSVEDLQNAMISLAETFGDLAAEIITFSNKAIQAFDDLANSAPVKFIAKILEALGRFVLEPIVMGGGFGEPWDAGDARRQAEERRKEERAASARLRTQNALSRAEAKSAAAKLAGEKKITNEKKKQAQEQGILAELNKRFDLERIQIAAALGGQINDVERLRLELMQAILDEDVKRAIILEGQLIKAEAAAAELALLLDSLDEMVGDPFADWPGTIKRIQELLSELKIKIPIETLFAEKGLKLDQDKMTVTKLDRMDVNANNVYINGKVSNGVVTTTITPPPPPPPPRPSITELTDDVVTAFLAGDPDVIAAVESNAEANAALANAELELANLLLAESGGDTNITVIVEGNVTSAEDLAEIITDIQYTYQKTGKGLLLQSRAI